MQLKSRGGFTASTKQILQLGERRSMNFFADCHLQFRIKVQLTGQ